SSSITAAGASLHISSMASWSPSQSDPLTVSYMCQRQSSSPMLPSAALMPPCAATVWLRVGNTLVMHAVDISADAALRRHGVAARREHLGDARRRQARLREPEGRTEPRPSG